jgi:hypothetical protein
LGTGIRAGDVAAHIPAEYEHAPSPGKKSPVAPKPRSVREKVQSFLAAVTGPKVSDAVFAERLAICRSNQCGYLRTDGEHLYCGACGCPKWRLAELHTKLRFANLECPSDPPFWSRIDSPSAV